MIHTILLIQFDPAKADAIMKALALSTEVEFHVEWVTSVDEGLADIASRANPRGNLQADLSAILVDLGPSHGGGIETFERLFKRAPHVPIVILTTATEEETARLAVQRGAQDYLLVERLDAYTLPKTLDGIIGRAAGAPSCAACRTRWDGYSATAIRCRWP